MQHSLLTAILQLEKEEENTKHKTSKLSMLIKYINNKIIKISVKNANIPLQLRETLVYPIGEMEWFGLKVQPIDIDGFIELKILVLPFKMHISFAVMTCQMALHLLYYIILLPGFFTVAADS